MTILRSEGAGETASELAFYTTSTNQSLRLDDDNSAYLYRTATAGDRRTFTWSGWYKHGNLATTTSKNHTFFSGGNSASNFTFLYIDGGNDDLRWYDYDGATDYGKAYNIKLRDTTNWYHIVYTFDTTQGTSADRVKAYVNGTRMTNIVQDYGMYGVNFETRINQNLQQNIGKYTGNTHYNDGYLADVHFTDGQALAPEAFAESSNGVWVAKQYATKITQIAQDTGSAIGDLTSQGGLSGAFNGTKIQAYGSGAATSGNQTTGYIGKNWGSSKTVTGFILYSPTLYGFVGSTASTFTVKLYGKNSSPSNATDGTLLFTSSSVNDNLISTDGQRGAIRYFADTNIQSEETISSFTTTTAYSYHWVVITPNSSASVHVGQIEFYEVGSNNYFGTNGYRLTFDSTHLNTSGSAVSDPSGSSEDLPDDAISDASGNGHHFSISGIDATDISKDTPTNNYCVLNPLNKQSSSTLSQGNLKATLTSGVNSARTGSTFAVSSGKWYWEIRQNSSNRFATGVFDTDTYVMTNEDGGVDAREWVYVTSDNSGNGARKNSGTLTNSYGNETGSGEVVMVALDADNDAIWFGSQGTWFNNGTSDNSATVKSQIEAGTTTNAAYTSVTGTLTPCCVRQTGNNDLTFNFGQDSRFGLTTVSAGSYSDDNGHGLFQHPVPTGFRALCSQNLPDVTLSPNQSEQANDYFTPYLYGANNQTAQTLTGVGFRPDWLWFKQRDRVDAHALYNTSMGIDKSMRITTDGEFDDSNSVTGVTALSNDGFTLGTDQQAWVNYQDDLMVAWLWRGEGLTPTRTYKVKVVADSTDYGHGTGSNKYQFLKSDGSTGFGTNGVDLDLQEGGTYVFDWSDSSAQSHPIRFSTTNNGTWGGGSEYTTNVVKDDSAYKTTITLPSTASGGVANLYYYCQNHSGMGAEIRTNATQGSTNFDGNILSVVQTNDTAKFSIVTFTGNNTNGSTVGHGLGVKPEWMIIKDRDTNSDGHWMVWHKSFSDLDNNLFWNLENAVNNAGFPSGSDPTTSTTFVPATINYNNVNNNKYVAYLFSGVEGYSKFGSYGASGTSDNSAPFVFTGFRPAFVMVKNTSNASYADWVVFDNKRDPDNFVEEYIAANTTEEEFTGGSTYAFMDFLSNGFKLKLGGTGSQVAYAVNRASGDTYIYMAFAEQPFRFSNAR